MLRLAKHFSLGRQHPHSLTPTLTILFSKSDFAASYITEKHIE